MDRTYQNVGRVACLPAEDADGKKKRFEKKCGAVPTLRFRPFRPLLEALQAVEVRGNFADMVGIEGAGRLRYSTAGKRPKKT